MINSCWGGRWSVRPTCVVDTFIGRSARLKLWTLEGWFASCTVTHLSIGSLHAYKMAVLGLVDCTWNVMAHAQKSDFVFQRNGRVHLNWQGRQFSRLLAAEVCASAVVMLDTTCSEVVWRVLSTHSIHQFPLHFSFCASPCAITFQLDSTRPSLLPSHPSQSARYPPTFPHNWQLLSFKSLEYLLELKCCTEDGGNVQTPLHSSET